MKPIHSTGNPFSCFHHLCAQRYNLERQLYNSSRGISRTTDHYVGIHMYLRFVIDKHDEDSGEPQGLFQAVGDLIDDGYLSKEERITAKKIFTWFAKNLPEPKRFSRSSKRGAKAIAISWFKPTANECIRQMQELAGIPYVHGVPTKVLKTRQPGYIVYEDDCQIVAQPFSGRK